jgi:phosphomethylpyrimidine synthase
VRISKEISLFVSGKDEEYAWDKPKISAALSDEQKEILQKRGVLSPAELHRLASKTKSQMADGDDQAACHSERVEEDDARLLQATRLDAVTLEPIDTTERETREEELPQP